jgi:hypothetical protein
VVFIFKAQREFLMIVELIKTIFVSWMKTKSGLKILITVPALAVLFIPLTFQDSILYC